MNRLFKFTLLILVFVFASCGNQSGESTSQSDDSNSIEYGIAPVEVYYFHATRRCPTCNKIEDVAKEFVLNNYQDSGVKFFSINFEESQNKDIADRFNVAWSSIFIVSGDKFEDLTDLAFQVINANPKQLTDKIQSVIDLYLETANN
jgi:predicted membrane-bound dolichyl-phosphate-mannose-protein mannosyltransferase